MTESPQTPHLAQIRRWQQAVGWSLMGTLLLAVFMPLYLLPGLVLGWCWLWLIRQKQVTLAALERATISQRG